MVAVREHHTIEEKHADPLLASQPILTPEPAQTGHEGFDLKRIWQKRDRSGLLRYLLLVLLVFALYLLGRFTAQKYVSDYLALRYPQQKFTLHGVTPTLFPLGYSMNATSQTDGTKFQVKSFLGLERMDGVSIDQRSRRVTMLYSDNYLTEAANQALLPQVQKIVRDDYFNNFLADLCPETLIQKAWALDQVTVADINSATTVLLVKWNYNIQNPDDFAQISHELWQKVSQISDARLVGLDFESQTLVSSSEVFSALGAAQATYVVTETTPKATLQMSRRERASEAKPSIISSGTIYPYYQYFLSLGKDFGSQDLSTVRNAVRIVEKSGRSS